MIDELELLFSPLEQLEPFAQLVDAVNAPNMAGRALEAHGLDDSQKHHMLAALARKTGRTLLIVTPSETAAQRAVQDLALLLPGGVMVLPSREVSFLRTAASSRELAMRRIEALGKLLSGELSALVAPADALTHRLMPRASFLSHIIELREGDRLDPQQLVRRLVEAGYEREDACEAHGQCAMRGGIVDVFPVGAQDAIRVEFFDDEIDSLRDFDVMTQRSTRKREMARIFPAAELLLTSDQAKEGASRLTLALEQGRSSRRRGDKDPQKQIEEAFGLGSFDDLFGADDEQDDGSKSAKKPKKAQPIASDEDWFGGITIAEDKSESQLMRTALGKHFSHRMDALKTGRAGSYDTMLMNVLLPETASLIDYFDAPLVVLDQPERLRERTDNRMLEFVEVFKAALEQDDALPAQSELLLTYDQLLPRLDSECVLLMHAFAKVEPDFTLRATFAFDGVGAAGYHANMPELKRDLRRFLDEGWCVAILAGGVARGGRLNKLLFDMDIPAPFMERPPAMLLPGEPIILPQTLLRGFLYPGIKFAILTDADIFGTGKTKAIKAPSGEKLAAFTDLSVGDYVVHESHGIGRYMGTVRLSSEGTMRDFLHIQYLGADKLYVPTDQLDRVQKYIGSEGEAPKLNRLSGGEWQKQKAKVKASIREIAGELVKLYAARAKADGHAFGQDTPWQREFEDSFEFEETPDQVTAIDDIKRDMEKLQVMDRLLCGDVGYGKTEVALRAIFKCVMDGKQAALLAPTTILVQQHMSTMKKRFAGFPVRVKSLSRFSTPLEQKNTLEALKRGELDVVVGTHRLLGKDVSFKNLGLLVVDEEQRFGVKHKETIKQMKTNVDVLTLSATPIPRTLHMSMVGIRDMSLLQTPPEERYPVQTYVLEYQDGIVCDAILREMGRGGQVYVLYNRVQTIEVMYERLKRLVPEARIAIGHGQMREHRLEDVMLDFYEGKYDVLLCTTIIEAGLDVPQANTLIVCDADRFGLSQLYQLRGRVGRSNRLAYAYLTVSPRKVLTDTADKRLSAIREFTEFGSGFRVAMRDLEIRGTGNLLGAEQSGHMASVGYDLYVKMIDESVRELRGDVSKGDIVAKMELKIDAYLPTGYVQSDIMRVEMYKKIAGIQDRAGREDLIEELIDRFGDPGKPVMNLIEIAHLKSLCQQCGIDQVTHKAGQLVMRFSPLMELDPMKLVAALKPFEKLVKLTAGRETALVYGDPKKPPEEQVRGAVAMMEDVARGIGEDE